MKSLYFERNAELIESAKETLKRIFLYSGADDVNEFNTKRCLNELGRFIDFANDRTALAVLKRRERQTMESIKKRDVNISPTIVIQPKKVVEKRKSMELFFDEYKEAYGLSNKDFGFGLPNPRSKEYVFNKAMFSRFAFGCGYKQGEIAKFLGVDRTTVIHYINEYKNKIENE